MARSNRNSAKNRPVTRVKSVRMDKAAKALMDDFKVTDLHNSKLPEGRPADAFSAAGGTPTQQEAARSTFGALTKGLVDALGFNQGKVNVNLGDGTRDPASGAQLVGKRR